MYRLAVPTPCNGTADTRLRSYAVPRLATTTPFVPVKRTCILFQIKGEK